LRLNSGVAVCYAGAQFMTRARIKLLLGFYLFTVAPAYSQGGSQVSLSAVPNPVAYGQVVTLTATVQPLVASGAVTFYDGANVLGVVPVSNGQAALGTSLLHRALDEFTRVTLASALLNRTPSFSLSTAPRPTDSRLRFWRPVARIPFPRL